MSWTMFLANVISLAEAGMPEIGEIIEMLENAQGLIEVITAVLAAIIGLISVVGSAIASILGIASTAFTVIFTVVVAVVAVLLLFLEYLGIAIPLFIIGRKVKCKFAWLAWVPVGQSLFAIFVMWKISGKEEFEFWNGKIRIRQGIFAVLGYVIISTLGSAIVTFIVAILNVIPGFGQIASLLATLLYYVPAILTAIMEYVYLRDVIRVFKADDKKCRNHAIIVVILDNLLTFGWARCFYLLSMARMKPLPRESTPYPESLPDCEV
jgi:phage-related protein